MKFLNPLICTTNLLVPSKENKGFIYLIINHTKSKMYIGQKSFYSTRTIKKKKTIVESDWKNYVGSNKELKEDIKNGDNYSKYIIEFVDEHLLYFESKWLMLMDVLDSNMFYNTNILGKFYGK